MSRELTEDGLLGGRVRLIQPREGFRAAVDPVLLAAFIPARGGEAVLELGCGTGAGFLCLNARVPGLFITAVERDETLVELAQRNAGLNLLLADIRTADARDLRHTAPVHHSFANPPYWSGGTPSPLPQRRQAAHEDAALSDWVQAMARPLRHKGSLTLVLPAARFAEAAAALREAKCGAIRLLPLWPRAGVAAKRILIQGRRGGLGPDEVLPGLVLHEADGSYTPAAQAVLRDASALT
ncbi:methyltransferase [Sediminicoccus sp. KRV36]|uniref:tRNA1(Val) (adenine(37)-N6)-methyltransferase n=1 Tax=Sediminicoccus sp. KRV36 TaxID=3133721 RepID=UPI00200EE11B|nr:methyltransferase [Sediminicoccus rosea]UPY35373.1 methyltransferase [Sediminicoccus rosea]